MKAPPPMYTIRKKLEMSFNDSVIELLRIDPLPTSVIAAKTGLTIGYVRTQLRLMEAAGLIEKVDDRVPIYYKANEEHPQLRYQKAIGRAKAMLLGAPTDEDFWLAKELKKYSKKSWPEYVDGMKVFAEAIEELHSEGKLVDTL